MKKDANCRPPKSEIRRTISRFRGNQQAWVRCRIRILEELMRMPDSTDSELAKNASTKLRSVKGLFQGWRVEGINAMMRFGHPPDLMEKDRKKLEILILTGELKSPEDVQEWVRKRPRLAKKNAFTLHQARAIYDRTRRVKRVRPLYDVPPTFLANLRFAKPEVAAALAKVLAGDSLREAAGQGCESLLPYYLRQAAEPKQRVRPLGFRQAFFAWCAQQNDEDVTFESVKKYLKCRGIKGRSSRTVYRYPQWCKDHNRIPRRHWTCGSSKHSGLVGL